MELAALIVVCFVGALVDLCVMARAGEPLQDISPTPLSPPPCVREREEC